MRELWLQQHHHHTLHTHARTHINKGKILTPMFAREADYTGCLALDIFMVDLTVTFLFAACCLLLAAALATNACNDARQNLTVYFFATTPTTPTLVGCAFALHCFNFSSFVFFLFKISHKNK